MFEFLLIYFILIYRPQRPHIEGLRRPLLLGEQKTSCLTRTHPLPRSVDWSKRGGKTPWFGYNAAHHRTIMALSVASVFRASVYACSLSFRSRRSSVSNIPFPCKHPPCRTLTHSLTVCSLRFLVRTESNGTSMGVVSSKIPPWLLIQQKGPNPSYKVDVVDIALPTPKR